MEIHPSMQSFSANIRMTNLMVFQNDHQNEDLKMVLRVLLLPLEIYQLCGAHSNDPLEGFIRNF